MNALTGCGRCHQWAHANPHEFGVWFAEKYSYRYDYLSSPKPIKKWHEDDFLEVENYLIYKAIDLDVDWINMPVEYQVRFKRKLSEVKND